MAGTSPSKRSGEMRTGAGAMTAAMMVFAAAGCHSYTRPASALISNTVFVIERDALAPVLAAPTTSPVPQSPYSFSLVPDRDLYDATARGGETMVTCLSRRRLIGSWPMVADTWTYIGQPLDDMGVPKAGSGAGALGVRWERDGLALRAEYEVMGAGGDTVKKRLFFEGVIPPRKTLVFFAPIDGEEGRYFHVVTFHIDEAG
jgi:hypothetical protein